MSNRNDAVNGADSDDQCGRTFGRRKMLQLAGISAVGTAVASTSASAAPGDDRLEIVTPADGGVEYEFVATGGVEKVFDAGDNSSEPNNDSITENDDGTYTVTGLTGNGYGDAYDLAGDVTSFTATTDQFTLYLNGNEVTVNGLTGQTSRDTLEIVTSANGGVEYEFVTTGGVEKVFDNGDNSAEPNNDAITENDDGTYTVTGLTGNGYGDTFALAGDVTAFSATTDQFTLYLNGNEVTVAELTGQPVDDKTVDKTSTHMVEIVTPADGRVDYAFTASGKITKVLDNGDNSAEPNNDTVTQNDDGTWTVTGLTGNGYGDTFEFQGEPLQFEELTGQYTLYLDGQETTVTDLTGQEVPSDRLEIVTPADGRVDYEFTVSGEISKVEDEGRLSAEGNDSITQNSDGSYTVAGITGNGYGDTFEFEGEPQSFSPKEGEFSLHLNGQQVSAYELVGEEPPADTTDSTDSDSTSDTSTSDGSTSTDGSSDGTSSGTADDGPIGGGEGYDRTVTRSDANIVVHNASELGDALSAASAGEVVFVPGDERINTGSRSFTVPSGVTVASNRGVNGAPGAELYTDQDVNDSFELKGSARFTGLRFRGAHPGSDTSSGGSNAGGVVAHGDAEIDNNEIRGFSHCAVGAQHGSRAHVHHNVITENNRDGLGYGVWVDAGDPVIEYNYFNYNRHSVAQSSDPGSYTVRYNHFGPTEVLHNIDVHAPSGDRYDIHNNVVETISREWDGNVNHIVSLRDVPRDVAVIQDNWFFNPNAPDSNGPTDTNGQVIIQPNSSSWQNVSFSGNNYGEDANVTYSDVIPGYDGWRS